MHFKSVSKWTSQGHPVEFFAENFSNVIRKLSRKFIATNWATIIFLFNEASKSPKFWEYSGSSEGADSPKALLNREANAEHAPLTKLSNFFTLSFRTFSL